MFIGLTHEQPKNLALPYPDAKANSDGVAFAAFSLVLLLRQRRRRLLLLVPVSPVRQKDEPTAVLLVAPVRTLHH